MNDNILHRGDLLLCVKSSDELCGPIKNMIYTFKEYRYDCNDIYIKEITLSWDKERFIKLTDKKSIEIYKLLYEK